MAPETLLTRTILRVVRAAVLLALCLCGCAATPRQTANEDGSGLRLEAFGRVETVGERQILAWRLVLRNHGTAPRLVHADKYTASYRYRTPEASGFADIATLSRPSDRLYSMLLPKEQGARAGYDQIQKEGKSPEPPFGPEALARGDVTVSARFFMLQPSVHSGKVDFAECPVDFEVPLQPMPNTASP